MKREGEREGTAPDQWTRWSATGINRQFLTNKPQWFTARKGRSGSVASVFRWVLPGNYVLGPARKHRISGILATNRTTRRHPT